TVDRWFDQRQPTAAAVATTAAVQAIGRSPPHNRWCGLLSPLFINTTIAVAGFGGCIEHHHTHNRWCGGWRRHRDRWPPPPQSVVRWLSDYHSRDHQLWRGVVVVPIDSRRSPRTVVPPAVVSGGCDGSVG